MEDSTTNSRVPIVPVPIHLVDSPNSPEFPLLHAFLRRSSVVALDAEWKPLRRSSDSTSRFPTVALLQIACRCPIGETRVFLLDLVAVAAAEVWEVLKEVFVRENCVKLGFRFKQDLVYLSSTFADQGCHSGFEKVLPFLDITNIYHLLKTNHLAKKIPKETKSLATICEELLGVSLSKELQCSDWSCRPLSKEQVQYAAADAYYLLEIFDVFRCSFPDADSFTSQITEYCPAPANVNLGLKEILESSSACKHVFWSKFCEASDIVKSSGSEILTMKHSITMWPLQQISFPFDHHLLKIVKRYGEPIILKESDRKPRVSKKKDRRRSAAGLKCQDDGTSTTKWEGPPPWDPSLGGDGMPKFLCDVMVEGLAKHLRCIGVDAAIPSSRKPEPRLLLNQAHKEKRVVLTRDAKLLKHQYLIHNQVYKVKSLLKNDQLLEVIDTFQLRICEDQLMSRCTKCNGRFIQKPLTIEEAVEASKGFQIIPDCLFKKDLEFWQCMDCNQLYWEGTQYHNAVLKFIDVCKLNE